MVKLRRQGRTIISRGISFFVSFYHDKENLPVHYINREFFLSVFSLCHGCCHPDWLTSFLSIRCRCCLSTENFRPMSGAWASTVPAKIRQYRKIKKERQRSYHLRGCLISTRSETLRVFNSRPHPWSLRAPVNPHRNLDWAFWRSPSVCRGNPRRNGHVLHVGGITIM